MSSLDLGFLSSNNRIREVCPQEVVLIVGYLPKEASFK